MDNLQHTNCLTCGDPGCHLAGFKNDDKPCISWVRREAMDDKPETHEEQTRRLEVEEEYGEQVSKLVEQVMRCDSEAADRLIKLFVDGEVSRSVIDEQTKLTLDNLMIWDSVTGGWSYWSSIHDKMRDGGFYNL